MKRGGFGAANLDRGRFACGCEDVQVDFPALRHGRIISDCGLPARTRLLMAQPNCRDREAG